MGKIFAFLACVFTFHIRQCTITFLLASFCLPVVAHSQMHAKWDGGEHLQLGLQGTLKACAELGITAAKCPNQNIQRADHLLSFKYGEIVTAGDFYQGPNDFLRDTSLGVAAAVKCAYKQKQVQAAQQTQDVNYPSCNPTNLFVIPGYLEIVSTNYHHFAWDNMSAYVAIHGQAIAYAKSSYRQAKVNPALSQELFNRALIFNGFADHYLTDAFASGHVRTPRRQIKDWAINNLGGPLAATRGDLMAMALHDHESLDLRSGREYGLPVRNARGDQWATRADDHLNLFTYPGDLTVLLPTSAVAASFKEVLLARMRGIEPVGVYSAAEFVPFNVDTPLATKLSASFQKMSEDEVLNALLKNFAFYERILFSKEDLQKMISQLPLIFVQFDERVRTEQLQSTVLQKRLPAAYLSAFRNLQ
jgi:hypothetical protein